MLTIKNYDKLNDNLLTEGWEVDYCKERQNHYKIVVKHPNHIKVINLLRTKQAVGNGTTSYFFYYAGHKTNQCVSRDYIEDMSRMLFVLSTLVKTL